MSISRRTLLGATAAAGVLAVPGTGIAFADKPVASGVAALPILSDDGLVAIPRGARAIRIRTIGVEPLLADKGGAVVGKTPGLLDGQGCFDFPAGPRLVTNHELRPGAAHTVPLVEGTIYDDSLPMGGCTVAQLNSRGQFVEQWVGLSGTIRNCAGGQTPWGSWLTAEEDTTKAGSTVTVAGKQYTVKKDHGYVFEVFPDVVANQIPEPMKAWGRAVWEGAAIGPDLTDAYITEDTRDGLFYRWTAPEGQKIGPGIARQFGENDGVLQAAQLVKNGRALIHYGELSADDLGKAYPVKWVDGGEDRQAQNSNLRSQFPGATVHPKIEGCWTDGEGLWFTLSYVNTSEANRFGIDTDSGMIMFYDYADQTLTLKEYYATGNAEGFDSPDNITVSPKGSVVIAEDGSDPCSLIAFSEKRGSVEIARDLGDRGEFAGPVFNKSDLLFANIQGECTYVFSGGINKDL